MPEKARVCRIAAPQGCAFRPIRFPDDEDFLRSLYASTRLEGLAITGWPREQIDAFLSQQFYAQQTHYLRAYAEADYDLLETEGQPIGRLYIFRSPSEINLMEISLLPEWRGRGIGTFLLRGLQAEAAQAGQAIILHVEPYNPAFRLYERLGFRLLGPTGLYLKMEWRSGTARVS